MANVSASPSTSLPDSVIGTVALRVVRAVPAFATGASLTEATPIATVAGDDCNEASATRNVNASSPLKLAVGAYTRFGAVPDNEPWAGGVRIVNASVSPSASTPVRTMAFGASSNVETDCGVACGAVFVGTVTVMSTNASSDVSWPSLAVKATRSLPT